MTTFRLPEQKIVSDEIVDAWCREMTDAAGLTFSVWEGQLQHRMPVGQGSTLTGLLLSQESTREPLKAAAAQVLQSGEPLCTALPCGLYIIAAPIQRRHRTVCAAVAVAVSDELELSCARQMLSNVFGLDSSEATRMIESEDVLRVPTLWSLGRLAARYAAEFIRRCGSEDEVSEVSRKLSEGYEEITLYQRMASNIRVSEPSEAFFQAMCSELIDFLHAEALAAVFLEGENHDEPRVVSLGRMPINQDGLLALYRHFQDELMGEREAVIDNHCSASAEISRIAPDVRTMIMVPLKQGSKLYGVIAGFNKCDNDEFYSTDVKLVASLSGTISVFVENSHLYEDLHRLMMGSIKALVSSIDAKDRYTCGHSERVAQISRRIARQMGIEQEDIDRIYLAGLLHDIGKIGVPESILLKSGRLETEEFEVMKTHPTIGARILAGVRELQSVIPGVLYHHERLDGRGYPRGLGDDGLPLDSRIIGLADALDAMTSNRVYRAAMPLDKVEQEIKRCAGTQFDVHCVDALLEIGLKDLLASLPRESQNDPLMTVRTAYRSIVR